QGVGHRLQADVPRRQHRAVPEGDRGAAGTCAHRAASPEPPRERAREVHRVRALRLRVPSRCDLGRGGGQRSRRAGESGRAVREGLPDQLPPLHHVRSLRRGLPHPGAHAHQLLRDGLHVPRGSCLDEGAAAGAAAHTRDRPGHPGGALMPLDNVGFWVFGPISVASAIGMLLVRNAVHAALFLIVNFFCLAVFYLLLDAPFLFAVQIVVYRSEEHTSELQSRVDLVCRLLLEKKKVSKSTGDANITSATWKQYSRTLASPSDRDVRPGRSATRRTRDNRSSVMA